MNFVVDTNPSWKKADQIVLGNVGHYKTVVNKDIGALLTTVDSTTQAIVYNWQSGVAYLKSSVVQENNIFPAPGYTTFVRNTSDFVSIGGGKLFLSGKPFIPVGFNAYWLGYTEAYTFPETYQIEEMFRSANLLSATVIRAHTLGLNTALYSRKQFNAAAWEPIDKSFAMARKYGVKLIVPLIDTYDYYNGNYGTFCQPYGIDKSLFWTDSRVRSDFKAAIREWLDHVNPLTGIAIKNSPELCIIEMGNELGNIRPERGSTTVPTQEWNADIAQFIRQCDSNHLIMAGSDECLGSNEFSVPTFDLFSAHFYWQDTSRFNFALSSGKPLLIGEYGADISSDFLTLFESQSVGTLFWSLYPHDSLGNRIPHDDGYTLYADNYDSTNSRKVLMLTNHMRRMQGLPPVTVLNFN